MSDAEEAALAEEREALAIQKRMLATLDEDDFDLDRFKVSHKLCRQVNFVYLPLCKALDSRARYYCYINRLFIFYLYSCQ